MANGHTHKISTFIVTKEMLVTLTPLLIQVRMAVIKELKHFQAYALINLYSYMPIFLYDKAGESEVLGLLQSKSKFSLVNLVRRLLKLKMYDEL